MSLRFSFALIAAFGAASPALAAQAQPGPAAEANRLFADSRLIGRDRISVEVVGQGPAVGAPTGPTDAGYRAAFAALAEKTLKRVDGSLHFIMLDQPSAFAADLDAFVTE